MLKLRITEYFDSLRNQLDLFTEARIDRDQLKEGFLCTRRDIQLQSILKIEQAALHRADKKMRVESKEESDTSSEAMSKIDSEFCFLINHAEMMFILTTKRYIPLNERQFLINILERSILSKNGNASCSADSVFGRRTIGWKSHSLNIILDILLTKCEIVDVTFWFDQEYQFERAEIHLKYNSSIKELSTPVRIEKLVFRCLYAELEPVKPLFRDFSKVKSLTLYIDPNLFLFDHIIDFPFLEKLDIIFQKKYFKGKSKIRFNVPKLYHLHIPKFIDENFDFSSTLATLSHAKRLDTDLHELMRFKDFKCSRLDFSHSSSANLSSNTFKEMNCLAEINFNSFGESLTIGAEALCDLPNLEKLSFWFFPHSQDNDSPYLKLEPGALKGTESLTELFIANYPTTIIEPGVFRSPMKFKKINIRKGYGALKPLYQNLCDSREEENEDSIKLDNGIYVFRNE